MWWESNVNITSSVNISARVTHTDLHLFNNERKNSMIPHCFMMSSNYVFGFYLLQGETSSGTYSHLLSFHHLVFVLLPLGSQGFRMDGCSLHSSTNRRRHEAAAGRKFRVAAVVPASWNSMKEHRRRSARLLRGKLVNKLLLCLHNLARLKVNIPNR